MNGRVFITTGMASLVLVALACAQMPQAVAGASASTDQAKRQDDIIEHVQPRRDSVGGMPQTYEWTAVKGAEHYSLGVWNEVDQMIFRQDRIPTTSYQWPADSKLDMGTYYWSVTAWRDERAIAGSGLAAFVVNR